MTLTTCVKKILNRGIFVHLEANHGVSCRGFKDALDIKSIDAAQLVTMRAGLISTVWLPFAGQKARFLKPFLVVIESHQVVSETVIH